MREAINRLDESISAMPAVPKTSQVALAIHRLPARAARASQGESHPAHQKLIRAYLDASGIMLSVSLYSFERDAPDLQAWYPFLITIRGDDRKAHVPERRQEASRYS